VVGAIALERHGTGPDTAFLLRSAVIDPAWRGHGVGGLLTDAALGWVDEVPAPVALLPETAADYFPRFGFTTLDRAALPAVLEASAELRGGLPRVSPGDAAAGSLIGPALIASLVTDAPGGGRVGRRPIPKGRGAPFRRPRQPTR
jgi:hypothetical protein